MGTLYFLLNFAINLKTTLLFFKIAFLMWTIFKKSLINLLQYCFCFFGFYFSTKKHMGS